MTRKKKILIGVVTFVVVFVVFAFWANNRNRTLSPPGLAELTSGDLTISISYSRPSVRGRVIFGAESDGALLPHGVYWRLGANEATEISINRDVLFNGQPVKAGTYKIYAVPGPDTFEMRLNSELGNWGYFEPDAELDLLSTAVPVQTMESPVEQLTIRLEPSENGIDVIFEFSTTRFVVPITRS